MSGIYGNIAGGDNIIPWNPVTSPNLIRSGVGVAGEIVLVLRDLVTPLDGVLYKEDDLITFDTVLGQWQYTNQSIEDRVQQLENAFDIVGNYDASTNIPDLNAILGVTTEPYQTWVVNVAGTQNITGIGSYSFAIGDRIIVNASNNGYFVQPNAPTGLPTVIITTATYNLVANTSYIIQAGQDVVLTLPTTIAFGDIIEINSNEDYNFTIAQNAGQTIKFNESITTTGVSGYIYSLETGSAITLKCVSANIQFKNQSQSGNFNTV